MTTKMIAVLMTVHNRRDKTLACLQALQRQLPVDGYIVDVWLTNDGCTDGTAEAVAEQFPEVHIVKGDGNLFWNRGMHAAWVAAASDKDYDYYLWLNDDTFLYPDAVPYVLQASDSFGCKSIMVGATCSKDDPTDTTYGGFIGKTPVKVNGTFQKLQKFNGNFVLIPRAVYNILGMNDPYFRHSFGDIDYGLRANKARIACYLTDRHIGTCERHEHKIKCFDMNYSLSQRIRHFYSPLGMNPFEFFHMNCRSLGLLPALSVFLSTHVRVIFPWLWK